MFPICSGKPLHNRFRRSHDTREPPFENRFARATEPTSATEAGGFNAIDDRIVHPHGAKRPSSEPYLRPGIAVTLATALCAQRPGTLPIVLHECLGRFRRRGVVEGSLRDFVGPGEGLEQGAQPDQAPVCGEPSAVRGRSGLDEGDDLVGGVDIAEAEQDVGEAGPVFLVVAAGVGVGDHHRLEIAHGRLAGG